MRYVILFFLFLPTLSQGAPCNGAPGQNHKNPDGSTGGFVAETASVVSSAYIDPSSSVCERARINGNVKLKSSSEVSGQALVEGNSTITGSRIYSQARVLGNSVVTGSVICQASEINFNVINSDYYCQTDDPEPKHPGELGKKTLLGIDSDVDGVRDDVEIWINNSTSNTPGIDYKIIRESLKEIARELQESLKYKENANLTLEARLRALNLSFCLNNRKSFSFEATLLKRLNVTIYNTMDRLKAWAKTEASLNGMSSLGMKRNCGV